jgi:exodeoxyribonuclease-3
MLSLLTWNVNSIRKRLDGLARLAELTAADVICLQETKVEDASYPRDAIAALGYPHQAIACQAGYNGVAILSRWPLHDIARHDHCGRNEARHIAAVLRPEDAPVDEALRIHSLYVPAGGPIADADLNPKFAHKLRFMDAVADHFAAHYGFREPMVLAGDLNVAPLPTDVWDHAKLAKIVTHTPVEIAALERIKRALAFTDVVREVIPAEDPVFTWWSYRATDWQAVNKGRRLDHIWVTAPLRERIAAVEVMIDVRHWQPPSDHVPVLLRLSVATAPCNAGTDTPS